ncbi:9396_t:CDS:2 [Dentiscutata erythropus]|uniref:9396_t:CDS:1 n=1 Tax=Dentiscutata erythropus TaxID=1348616 RepID=A0A9N8ZCX2_9GLOM|nr:9396_t:CDS:2 [Dentiscutata erythropus]
MASDKVESNSKELHDYPRKPEIKYKDSSASTYHYTIISERYYLSLPILVRTQKKNNNSYKIPDNYKVLTYNSKGTSTLSGTIVFGLQLKCVEQARDTYRHNSIFRPIESLSNSGKRSKVKQIGEKVRDYIDYKTTYLHYKDQIQIKSLALSVDNQDWILDYSKDKSLEK